MQTLACLLLTLAALGFSFITIVADLNKTHAANPLWTPHARFHVVWQVLSYSGVGLISLYLIWAPGPMQTERLYLAAALAVAVYAGFFGAVVGRPIYGGGLYDQNGYPSFRAPIGPKTWMWDVNVTAFTVTSAILLAGIAAVLAS
jgi:tryptophan-rich sensory protein